MDRNLNLLNSQIQKTKKNRSSSYKIYLKNADYRNIYSHFATGGFQKKNILRSLFNFFFSRVIFKFSIFSSRNFKKLMQINKRLNVSLNINMIWHVIILNILKKETCPNNICVIGDGKANFILNALINFTNAKIYSINLTEVLINDYLILKKSQILKKNEIDVISKINQKINYKKKIFLIPANLKEIINKVKIDLFVSIECLQELNISEQKNYLKIISKQKNAFFYFLERESKILPGGEKNLFKNFFPKKCKIIFNKQASFRNIFYNTKFPFIHFRDKTKRHALVKLS
tara:strand:+ start:107 stop:970 length:864 start_codon:yes stop_codon:yes gene_type:complete